MAEIIIYSSIYVVILPALATILIAILIPLLYAKEKEISRKNKRFSGVAVLIFLFNLSFVGSQIYEQQGLSCLLCNIIYPLFIFLIPLGFSISRHTLGMPGKPFITFVLSCLASVMVISMWGGSHQQSRWLFSFVGFICTFYYLYNFFITGAHKRMSSLLVNGAMIALLLMTTLTIIPWTPFEAYPPLTFAFIPFCIITLGVVERIRNPEQKKIIRGMVIKRFALIFICIPLVMTFYMAFSHIQYMNMQALREWIMPYGILLISSLVICSALAVFCLQRGRDKTEQFLLAIVCILWCINNLWDLQFVIFPEKIAVAGTILNDSYIVFIIGPLAHLALIMSGKVRLKWILPFYGISIVLMPFMLYQTMQSHVVYHYPSGPYIKTQGLAYDLLESVLLFVLAGGIVMLYRSRKQLQDQFLKHKNLFFIIAYTIGLILLLSSIPLMYGKAVFPYHNLLFIPFLIVGYAIFANPMAQAHTRMKILSRIVLNVLVFIYAILAVCVFWILKDLPVSHVSDRLIPYGIPPLLTCIVGFLISIFALLLEKNRTETILFSIICAFLGGVGLDLTLITIITDQHLALLISRIDQFVLVIFVPGTIFHLLYHVGGKNPKILRLAYITYALGVLMAPSTLTPLYYSGSKLMYWGICSQQGPLFVVFGIYWIIALASVLIMMIKAYYKTGNQRSKDTLKLIILCFGAITILEALNGIPIWGYDVYPMGAYSFVPLLIVSYFLSKNNLMLTLQYLRIIISTILCLVSMSLIALVPMKFMPDRMHEAALIAGIILAVFTFRLVQRVVNTFMNLFIPNPADDMKQQYFNLTQGLSQVYQFKEMEEMLCQWLYRVFLCSRCIILTRGGGDSYVGAINWNPAVFDGIFAFIKEENGQQIMIPEAHPLLENIMINDGILSVEHMEQISQEIPPGQEEWLTSTEIIIPVYLLDQLKAMVLLGPKVDGNAYTNAELEVLRDLGPVLGPNIENSRLMEGLQKEVERRSEDLNNALIDSLMKEKEITEFNEIITRQNEIFRSLLEISNQIHQIWKLDELYTFILDHLHSLFSELGFGIILEGGRPDVLECISFIGIPEDEQSIILRNREHLLDLNIDDIIYQEIKERDGLSEEAAEPDMPHWTIFPMMIPSQGIIGKMIIKGTPDQSTSEVITVFLGQISAVTQSKLLMRELERMASTDGLTGVYNRTYFNQEHIQSILNANRYRIPFSIAMIDVNGLKEVNDCFGHEKGDEMIIMVAHLLRDLCRKTDIIARIGGDEFAALMPSTNYAQAEHVMNRVRQEEEKLQMFCKTYDCTAMTVPVRISIGLASSDKISPDEVFKEADKRMYLDKEKYYENKSRYR